MSSLMAALDEARDMINEGITEVDHRNRWVAQIVTSYQENPERVAELYEAAGMIGPSVVAAIAPRMSSFRGPHANAVTQRVMAALSAGSYTSSELAIKLGVSPGAIQTAILRLRARGADIRTVSIPNRRGRRYSLGLDASGHRDPLEVV
jgi:biotin operon repressor